MINNILSSLTKFFSDTAGLFRNPSENAAELVILLAVVLLLILVTVIAISLVGAIRRAVRQRRLYPGEPRPPDPLTRRRRAIVLLSGSGVLLIVFLLGLGFSAQPSFCNRCHVMQDYYANWTDSSHKGAGCLTCHQRPGLLGLAAKRLEALQNLQSFALNNYAEPLDAAVGNEICVRCHDTVLLKVFRIGGIRIKHQELMTGYRCADCHSGVAHENSTVAKINSQMGICMRCHDGEKASGECRVCHYDDKNTVAESLERFSKATVDLEQTCEACHAEDIEAAKARTVALAKPAYEKACAMCHGLDLTEESMIRGEGWAAVLHRMQNKGCIYEGADFESLLLYLKTVFP